jgi:hypothetical protein
VLDGFGSPELGTGYCILVYNYAFVSFLD